MVAFVYFKKIFFVSIPKIVIFVLYKTSEEYFWQYNYLAGTKARKLLKNISHTHFKELYKPLLAYLSIEMFRTIILLNVM